MTGTNAHSTSPSPLPSSDPPKRPDGWFGAVDRQDAGSGPPGVRVPGGFQPISDCAAQIG
jgi:hypothetical protein